MSADWPLSEGDDAYLLHAAGEAFPNGPPRVIGVAVSGGSDSMALLHLCARLQAHRGGVVRAATVDHRLRPEAADEARRVAGFCTTLGIGHDTLIWNHGEISGNLQDQARRARYALLGDWARVAGVADVVLGHTADDQAETFLMGLAREAGLDGLSGMRRAWQEGGVTWSRPLLLRPRRELRDYLTRNGIDWVEDPSNADDRFTRVKARRALKALKPLGITVDKLTGVILNLGSALQAVREATAEAAARLACTGAGEVVLSRQEFDALTPEINRRLLIAALKWVSGETYMPRQAALIRVQEAVREARHATLSGCRIRVSEAEVRITREPKAVAGLEGPTDAIWDGRWRLCGPHSTELRVRALGAEGLRACPNWRETGFSRAALVVSPAIWRGESLVAAPVAGHNDGWTAEIVAGFHSFLISH